MRYSEPSVYTLGGAQPWLDAQGGQRPMSVFIETIGVGGSMKKASTKPTSEIQMSNQVGYFHVILTKAAKMASG